MSTTPKAIDKRLEPARDVLGDLRHLIEALDARVPQLERIGEARIARDAAELRERAVQMIHRIETDLAIK